MKDIQKAIDTGFTCDDILASPAKIQYVYTPKQIKFIVEQVAKKAFEVGHEQAYSSYQKPCDADKWWNEQDLTFNE